MITEVKNGEISTCLFSWAGCFCFVALESVKLYFFKAFAGSDLLLRRVCIRTLSAASGDAFLGQSELY